MIRNRAKEATTREAVASNWAAYRSWDRRGRIDCITAAILMGHSIHPEEFARTKTRAISAINHFKRDNPELYKILEGKSKQDKVDFFQVNGRKVTKGEMRDWLLDNGLVVPPKRRREKLWASSIEAVSMEVDEMRTDAEEDSLSQIDAVEDAEDLIDIRRRPEDTETLCSTEEAIWTHENAVTPENIQAEMGPDPSAFMDATFHVDMRFYHCDLFTPLYPVKGRPCSSLTNNE